MDSVSKNIALAILMIVVSQCGSKETGVTILPPELSDPYLQSFRDKNIKYIFFERLGAKDPYPDTIELDRRGNIVRITGPDEEEKRAYDVNGFLVRRWLNSDYTVQYIARYSIHGDTLVQSWREFNSSDWNLHGDTSTRPHEVNLFIFDQNGRVTQEFNNGFGPLIYIYSKKKLSRKEIEIRRNNEDEFIVEKPAEFDYDDQGEIKRIKLKTRDERDKEQVFYFSRGLLDSCRITTYREYRSLREQYRYRYVYY